MTREGENLYVRWTRALGRAEGDEYDRFVDEARGGHPFQTRAWAAATLATRPLVARWFRAYEVTAGSQRLVGAALVLRGRRGPLPSPRAFVERGPVCGEPRDLERVLRALRTTTRLRAIAKLTVMPYFAGADATAAEAAMQRAGFRLSQTLGGAHAATLRLAIGGKSDEEILAGKDHETLRRKLRQAEKAGAVARRAERRDMPALARLHAELMATQDDPPKPLVWFEAIWDHVLAEGSRGAAFICEHEGEAIAAHFVTRHGRLAKYQVGATTTAERSFSKMALPMMAAVRWARDAACDVFDFGGAPMDGDTDARRASITQFKLDFTKERVMLARQHSALF